MAQVYRPFPTTLNPAEAFMVELVLQECIPCNLMCMAPHNMPRHSRYTHVHDCGSSIFVTILIGAEGNGTVRSDLFKALIEDAGRLLMKGASLPVGHYPVSGISSDVQTVPPSTALHRGGEVPAASSTNNIAAAASRPVPLPSTLPGEFNTLSDSIQSMYK
ncbi:hypothetical protein LXA43DRAFT_1068774 [Ganoderma leucocontextum]|nr:hypothetical protein LXA43DRAFT_1068774 [Ganoderma leucocontextum]